ncbi:N-6 DNA methylase [Patescibacteria group bacterium]|nr:N-6 DNA methylase [Patescibacteria group bacterium]
MSNKEFTAMSISPERAAENLLRTLERNPEINETGRRELFIGYIIVLFPKYAWQIREYALGAEKTVKIPPSEEEDVVLGRIDTKKGSLIIEYKTSVERVNEQNVAEVQLKKYVAGIMCEEGKEAVTKGISTDILNWHEYKVSVNPRIPLGSIKPEDVILSEKRSYFFSSDNPNRFIETVERLVFEEVPIIANAKYIVDEFGLRSKIYRDFKKALRKIWEEIYEQSEVELGLNLWSRFIENCFDQTARPNEENYLDHVYLVILSRLLAGFAIATVEEQTDPTFPIRCVTGEFFQSGTHRVQNFVENDFFRWVKHRDIITELAPELESLHRKLEWLDFRSAPKFDLLTEIYAEIMPPEQKTEYGVVFTPTWLVNQIVDNIEGCEEENKKILDPACGTGSFLRSVLAKKMERLNGKYSKPQILEIILDDICGLDINPVSVVIAKTTIMLTLSELLKISNRPVEIPIYLCDSLFLPELRISSSEENVIEVNLDSAEIHLPSKVFSEGTTVFDQLIQIVSTFARDAALELISPDEGLRSLEERIEEIISQFDLTQSEHDLLIEGLTDLFYVLIERIRKKRNIVWAFVLKNTYRPSLLREQFDVIVSNPPWLAMSSFPAARYKEELESLIEYYKLPPLGPSRHHMEISTMFSIHCANKYLKKGGTFAFILPRVILNGYQHDPLRKSDFLQEASLSINYLWDLVDVEPLFKRPACVIFGNKSGDPSGFPKELPCKQFHGNPFDTLTYEEKILYLTTLGAKSSYSYSKQVYHEASLRYKRGFKQGADLMPRRSVIVDILTRKDAEILSITTSESEINNPLNKAPYDTISLTGTIEKQYIFNTLKSDAVLPFVHGEPVYAALPVQIEDNSFRILDVRELLRLGHIHARRWFQRVDEILLELSRKDLSTWLKRRNKLINQSTEKCEFLVLYGAGGTNVTSCVLDTSEMDFTFINDQTLYAWRAPSENEAWYVCGMLNSKPINDAIKDKQALGAFGEQHIHELPLSLIPRFDPGLPEHIELANEAKRINQRARQIVQSDRTYLDTSLSLASRRRRFSRIISSELEELNRLSESILEVSGK